MGCIVVCIVVCNGSLIVGIERRDCKTLKEGGGGGSAVPAGVAVKATSSVCTPVDEVCKEAVTTGQLQQTQHKCTLTNFSHREHIRMVRTFLDCAMTTECDASFNEC